jgi:hypothetical protein
MLEVIIERAVTLVTVKCMIVYRAKQDRTRREWYDNVLRNISLHVSKLRSRHHFPVLFLRVEFVHAASQQQHCDTPIDQAHKTINHSSSVQAVTIVSLPLMTN